VWGWPLVYVYNQRNGLTRVPETGLLAGVMPISPMNQVGMLTGYVNPGETFIDIPNQDVVYGLGYLSLAQEPVVLQVPDFGERFWTFPVYDARTDEISELGLQYGSKPGFVCRGNCTIATTVDGKPVRIKAFAPSTGEPALMIRDDQAFIAMLRKAKKIGMDVTLVDGEKKQTLVYEVGGFDPAKWVAVGKGGKK